MDYCSYELEGLGVKNIIDIIIRGWRVTMIREGMGYRVIWAICSIHIMN